MTNESTHYELTYIIPGNVSEDEHPKILEKVSELLTKFEAEVTSNEDLGRRKFAYPIKKLRHGFYHSIELDLNASNVKLLEDELKLDPNVLRFLIIKKHLITEEEKKEEKKVIEKIAKTKIAKVEKKEADKEKADKQEKEDKKKVSLEDLDKKLDELLKEEVI